jgi:phosphoglycerate kinase
MNLKSIKNTDVKGKRVLMRVDFNVPLEDGKIADETRITKTLPTIKYLIEQGAKLIIMTHVGRPEGQVVEELRTTPLAKRLSELIGKDVKKVDDCVGKEAEEASAALSPGEALMLENTRFHKEDEENDHAFAEKLSKTGEIFVMDAFGAAHRKNASTYEVSKFLPTYAGLLIEAEITALSPLLANPKKPLTLIMGGAKIDTKIGVLKSFLPVADYILIGGALANTFQAARGFYVGKSLYEEDKLDLAREIMLSAEALGDNFILPEDVIVASEASDDVKTLDLPVQDIEGDMQVFDIGSKTLKKFQEVIKKSATVVWNGPVGLTEKKPFRKGTAGIGDAITDTKGINSIIGGGDTIDALNTMGFDESQFTHVSTGGGAMLEFLEGKELPGIEIIKE